jgi:hypothetical membrane protein
MTSLVSPRLGALAGLAGLSLWIILYAVAAFAMASGPGYSITKNYLSDLGNPKSPAPWAFNSADMIAGIAAIPFGLALGSAIGGRVGRLLQGLVVAAGVALTFIGIFPEESPYDLHGRFSTAFFLLLTLSLGVLTVPALRSPVLRPVGGWVTAVAFVFNVVLVLTTVLNLAAPQLGEHLGVYAALAWQLSTSLHLWRSPAPAVAGAPTPG